MSVESDRRRKEKEMHETGRQGSFVTLPAGCAITHTANLPFLTCFSHACVSTVNNGYLIQGNLAMIVEGGYVRHVGDLPLEAVTVV
jgi:hypothetical protein